jgi:hypothetical protein
MAGKPWTTEEENLLKEHCGKHISYKKMVAYIPTRTALSLQAHARLKGWSNPICNRIYDYDREFFKEPNYINSFFSGWIAADGYVRRRDETYYDFAWEMKSEDEEFLFLLKKVLNYNGPVDKFFDTGQIYRSKPGEYHSRIRLNSIGRMADDLKNNFSITPNKTYRLGPPLGLGSIELKIAFLIGVINGDGCVHLNKGGSLGIKVYGSGIGLLKWVKEVFDSLNIFAPRKKKGNNLLDTTESNACKQIGFYGVQAIYFYELVKKCPVPVLKRKWEQQKIEEFIIKLKKERPEWFPETIEQLMLRNNIDFSKTFPSPENNPIIAPISV